VEPPGGAPGHAASEPPELLEEPPVLDRGGEVRGAFALDDQPVGHHVVARGQSRALQVDTEPLQLRGHARPPFAVIEEHHAR